MYSNAVDIPRIYTALAEWGACIIFSMLIPRRVTKFKYLISAILFLLAQSVLLVMTENVWIYFWFPIMVLAVIFMYIFLSTVCSLQVKSTLYFTLKAFLAAEAIASLEWQIVYSIGERIELNLFIQASILLLVYLIMFRFLYFLEKSIKTNDFDYAISKQELVTVILIVLAVFSFSNLSFVIKNSPFSSGKVKYIFNVRTLVDFWGIAILFAYQSRVFELQVEKELLAINTVLKSQYDNYRNYSENIELINLKYHDLKHQLEGLRAEMSQEKRMEWIDTMETELESYRPETQTGNHTLDTLLSGKIHSCRNQSIKFTCVVDGQLISFMHVMDICNIFGNALDNAIENVALVEDENKRLIHMRVFSQGTLVFISVSNYCEKIPVIKNGLPISTKLDKGNHGFGLKSIYHTVKKYNGNVSFSVENQMFDLKILIPTTK